MFKYYKVNNTYSFTHYGEALSFSRRIGGRITIHKTCNPVKILSSFIDSIT